MENRKSAPPSCFWVAAIILYQPSASEPVLPEAPICGSPAMRKLKSELVPNAPVVKA